MAKLRVALLGLSVEVLLRSPLLIGPATFQTIRGQALDEEVWLLRGAIRRLRAEPDIELCPLIWGTALPGGALAAGVYRDFMAEALDLLGRGGPFDGVFLANHGSLEVEGIERPGDADFVAAVRARVGAAVPIAVALDLHGNAAPELLASATVISALRTAPHRDDAETGYRAADQLVRTMRGTIAPRMAAVRVPILAPGEAAVTTQSPGRELYRELAAIDAEPGIVDANLLVGFAWNDAPWTGMTALVTADGDAGRAARAARALAGRLWNARRDFVLRMETAEPSEGLRRAAQSRQAPIYLSDAGDNTTAGAPGDLTLVLQALLDTPGLEFGDAVVAGILAPGAVAACRAAGPGAVIELALGAEHISRPARLRRVRATVQACGDALRLAGFQPYGGAAGGWARIGIGGVTATLHEQPVGITTPAHLAAMGIDPKRHRVYVVKLGYLHPQLEDIAARHILLLSEGLTDLDMRKLAWSRLPRPCYPLDPDMAWTPG